MTLGLAYSYGKNQAINASSLTITNGFALPYLNWLVFGWVSIFDTETITSVTDSVGNSYTIEGPGNNSNSYSLYGVYAINTNGLSESSNITINLSGTAAKVSACFWLLQGAGSGTFDQIVFATGTDTSPTVTTASLAYYNEVVFAALMVGPAATGTVTQPGSPWGTPYNEGPAATGSLFTVTQTVTTNTAVTYSPTLSVSNLWLVGTATFQAANVIAPNGYGLGTIHSHQNLISLKSIGKLPSIGQSETVSFINSLGRFVSSASTEFINAIRVLPAHTLASVSSAQVVSEIKSNVRQLSIASSEVVSTLQKAIGNGLVSVSSSEVAKAIRQVSISSSKVISAEVVNTIRSSAKAFSVTSSETVHAIRSALKPISINSSEVINIVRASGRTIRTSGTQVVGLLRAFARGISIASAESVSLLRASVRKLLAASAETVGTVKAAGRALDAISAEVASIFISAPRAISTSLAEVVSRLSSVGRSVSSASAEQVSVLKTNAALRSVSVSSGETVHNRSAMARFISVASSQLTAILRQIPKRISVTSIQSAFANLQKPKKVLTSETQVVHTSYIPVKLRSFATTLAQSASLVRGINKVPSIVSAQVINVLKAIGPLTLSIAQANIAYASKTLFHAMGVAQAQVVNLRTLFGVIVSVASAQVIGLFDKQIKRRFQMMFLRYPSSQ